MKSMHCFAALVLMTALVGQASGQQAARPQFPAGYKVRPDDPAADLARLSFESMAPGWHITTGPAVILYDPARTASGSFRVVSQSFLFEPGRLNEAYGVFIGGRNLEAADQAYTYFVIRRSGEFLIRKRAGSATSDLVNWAASPAILKWDARGEATTAKNVLAIDAGEDSVRFLVNDQVVATLPRAQVGADGIVGLRVNHSINLHVSSLDVTQK
jgi:hypothetical protein